MIARLLCWPLLLIGMLFISLAYLISADKGELWNTYVDKEIKV